MEGLKISLKLRWRYIAKFSMETQNFDREILEVFLHPPPPFGKRRSYWDC
jgi:hypothetical protein